MNQKIKDVCDIFVGYTFRGAIVEENGGDMFVLQAKNIKSGEYISSVNNFSKIFSDKYSKAEKVKYNDVVIVSRGSGLGSFKSAVFKYHANNIIASSSVLIIRVKSEKVLPEYLSLYLNSETGQTILLQVSSGSAFKTLIRRNLEEVNIPLPSIKEQQDIVDLCENIMQQENIMLQATEIKKRIMNGIFGHISNI